MDTSDFYLGKKALPADEGSVPPLVLITDCDYTDTDIERAIFATAGLQLHQVSCRSATDVLEEGGQAVALLVQYAPVTAEVIAGLPLLQVVGRYGTGVDTIDLAAAAEYGVEVVCVAD